MFRFKPLQDGPAKIEKLGQKSENVNKVGIHGFHKREWRKGSGKVDIDFFQGISGGILLGFFF